MDGHRGWLAPGRLADAASLCREWVLQPLLQQMQHCWHQQLPPKHATLLLTLLLPLLVPVCLCPCVCLCVSSVTFNYLGRDFFNALSEKDVDGFKLQLIKYLIGFCLGESV
jgi:hypothetical protein